MIFFFRGLPRTLLVYQINLIWVSFASEPDIDEFGRLLARLPRQQRLTTALFYVDGLTVAEIAETLDAASRLATSLAGRENAKLEVIHAWELAGESMLTHGRARIPRAELEILRQASESRHRQALDNLLLSYDLSTEDDHIHLIKGKAAESITMFTQDRDIDLIVMGTLGRAGIAGLFIGNTAENVLRETQTAVLTVKPEGFITPVQ